MATTPPPPSTLRFPPTPRHGAGYDQYEPYSTRHSARLAGQRASREANTTPPPTSPTLHAATPKTSKKQRNAEAGALSPPKSAQSSPQKKRSARTGFVPPYSLDGPSDPELSDPFAAPAPLRSQHPSSHSIQPTMIQGMLPTPAKTPKKKAVGDVGTAARALFPPATSGRKKSKKHTGFSLDSFDDGEAQSGSRIQIYTDSRDRIPEVDESESNPFYKKPAPSNTTTRASRRRDAGKRDKEVDEAIKRDDGMVYVFRGKKTFRKFDEAAESDEEDDDDDDLGLLSARPDLIDSSIMDNARPLTRSSIKPRVLFPSANGRAQSENPVNDTDEEAATDIEDHALPTESADIDNQVADIDVPKDVETPHFDSTVATPGSPGATIRSLRSRTKKEVHTPTITESRKRASPFDGWMRKKQTSAVPGPKSKKRDAEATGSPAGPATKKTRGTRSAVSS